MKHHHLLLPAFLLLTGCSSTGSHFQSLDLDGSGAISRGEFTDAVAGLSFSSYDRNGDNVVDLAEWRAVERGNGNDALFRTRDMSRNGRISRPEARLAAEKNGSLTALFKSIDTNKNGVLDRAEAKSAAKVAAKAARR